PAADARVGHGRERGARRVVLRAGDQELRVERGLVVGDRGRHRDERVIRGERGRERARERDRARRRGGAVVGTRAPAGGEQAERDIEGITRIDERITRTYRPEVWERRVGYYIRRDADSSQVAEVGGKVAGFMMGEVRGGEFGLEEPTGWIEFFGVDPDARGRDLGRKLIDALLAHFRAQGAHIARTMVA